MDRRPSRRLTAEQRRQRRLESYRRYNLSPKGRRRNQEYEDRNPSRRLRWEPARKALAP